MTLRPKPAPGDPPAPTYGLTAEPLLQHGYHPIPITPGSKVPSIKGWTEPMSAERTLQLAANGAGDMAVGLLLGLALGDGTEVRALDVDVADVEAAKQLLKLFPNLLLVRIGRSPRWLALVRVPVGVPELRSAIYGDERHHCQLLGRGRQCVIYGIHPDTGRPYHWPRRTPLEVAVHELPLFVPADWDRLTGELAAIAVRRGWALVQQARVETLAAEPEGMPSEPVDLSDASVRELVWRFREERRPRDAWRAMGSAIHHQYRGGLAGLDLWDEWSRDCREYLDDGRAGCEREWSTFDYRNPRALTLRSYLRRAQHEQQWEPREWTERRAERRAAPPPGAATSATAGAAGAARSGGGDSGGGGHELQPIDLSGVAWGELEGPRWLIQDWLPAGAVTLLAGDGGSGKSYVSLVIAVMVAAARGVLCASDGERRPVLYYSAEDPRDVLLWRVERICTLLMIDPASLHGWLFLYDATATTNALFVEHPDPAQRLTARYDWLAAQIDMLDPGLIVLDNASDLYDASENERGKVRQFVGSLTALAQSTGAALVLLSHLDRVGAQAGGEALGYSGSTAWNNSVRSRLFLYQEGEPNQRILTVRKNNWGGAQHQVRVTWQSEHATFAISEVDPAPDADAIAVLVWQRLREVIEAGETVTVATGGPHNAFAHLSRTPGWPRTARREQVLELVEEFARAGLIVRQEFVRANRRRAQRWALAGAEPEE